MAPARAGGKAAYTVSAMSASSGQAAKLWGSAAACCSTEAREEGGQREDKGEAGVGQYKGNC